MKLMRNPGGVVAWHSDDDAAVHLQPLQDNRPSGWEVLLSTPSDEEVPEELKAEAAALMRGDAPAAPAPAPASVVETPVDLATGEPVAPAAEPAEKPKAKAKK